VTVGPNPVYAKQVNLRTIIFLAPTNIGLEAISNIAVLQYSNKQSRIIIDSNSERVADRSFIYATIYATMNYNSTLMLGDEDYSLLKTIMMALTKYVWAVPVAIGIPGNILAILVANRKHNRKLSPCIYMTAMAVADSLFLLEVTWYYSLLYQGYLDDITDMKTRGLIIV
jgi:hypothetical protein